MHPRSLCSLVASTALSFVAGCSCGDRPKTSQEKHSETCDIQVTIPQIEVPSQDSACVLSYQIPLTGEICMHVHYLEADVTGDGRKDQLSVQDNTLSTPLPDEDLEHYVGKFDVTVSVWCKKNDKGYDVFTQPIRIARLFERPESLAVGNPNADNLRDIVLNYHDQEIVFLNCGDGLFKRQVEYAPYKLVQPQSLQFCMEKGLVTYTGYTVLSHNFQERERQLRDEGFTWVGSYFADHSIGLRLAPKNSMLFEYGVVDRGYCKITGDSHLVDDCHYVVYRKPK